MIYDSFEPIAVLPPSMTQMLKKYPAFFNRESKPCEKENNEILNDSLILYPRKFFEGLKEPKREPMISSSDPDWNSDDDVDGNMESKAIDEAVVEKIVEKMKDRPGKRPDKLKPHEKRFLEDHYRGKREK